MTQKQSVSVRIAGEEHVIRASAEPDYTRRCASYVDERIMEIREKAGLLESHKAAILAALSITDELLQTQKELQRLRSDVSQEAAQLARRLEAALPGGPATS
jgi:cell division protein ZapA (FtsZ GTPase activity inhibitor)